jgi:hypothetical protein
MPGIKLFAHVEGYNNSNTVVLNDAKVTSLPSEHCTNSACMNSLPRRCCRSVKLWTFGKVCKRNHMNGVIEHKSQNLKKVYKNMVRQKTSTYSRLQETSNPYFSTVLLTSAESGSP